MCFTNTSNDHFSKIKKDSSLEIYFLFQAIAEYVHLAEIEPLLESLHTKKICAYRVNKT